MCNRTGIFAAVADKVNQNRKSVGDTMLTVHKSVAICCFNVFSSIGFLRKCEKNVSL